MGKNFFNYWLHNFKESKDGFDYTMLIGGSLFLIFSAVCKFGSFTNPVDEFITNAHLERWCEVGAIAFYSVWCFVWLPFKRYVQTNEKLKSEIQILVDENKRLKAEIEDSPRLDIIPTLMIEGPPQNRALLSIKVVNNGNKPVRVEKVAVLIERKPIFPVGNPSVAIMPDSSEMKAFQKEFLVEIKPDHDLHIWQMPFNRNPHFEVHTKDGEHYGKGYILLSSGKTKEFDFLLFDDSTWNHFAK